MGLIIKTLTRQTVDNCKKRCIHPGRSIAQCDIWEIEIDNRRYLLKDYGARHFLLRKTWGKYIIAKEIRIYQKLQGIVGIPRLVASVDDCGFVMEYLDATRLPKRKHNNLTPQFFKRLAELVDTVHQRNIAHGDLRRKNILVDTHMRPYLIDFATAFALQGNGNFVSRRIFRHLCWTF